MWVIVLIGSGVGYCEEILEKIIGPFQDEQMARAHAKQKEYRNPVFVKLISPH